jgi:hypothetical protein
MAFGLEERPLWGRFQLFRFWCCISESGRDVPNPSSLFDVVIFHRNRVKWKSVASANRAIAGVK